MTIAPHVEDKEQIQAMFRTLKNIFDHISDMDFPNVKMKYLSMGMSDDFEIAIQEVQTSYVSVLPYLVKGIIQNKN